MALGLFILTLIVSAMLSEFFRAPLKTDNIISEYRNLFKRGELENIQRIDFKNGLGEITLIKNGHSWDIKNPRALPAKESVVKKIITSLEAVKIKKIFSKDAINISNYSLNPPLVSLTLYPKDGEKFQLDHGLIDSITNSTYLTHSNKSFIFQVSLLEESFEKYDLSNFINPNIISLPETRILSLKIYRGKKDERNLRLSLNYQEDKWISGKTGRELNAQKVDKFIDELISLKSVIILDQISEKMQEGLTKYTESPLYTMEINSSDEKTYEFLITPLIHSLPDMKLEKRQNFIIVASNRKHPYMLTKEHINLFSAMESQFGKVSIKKLFY